MTENEPYTPTTAAERAVADIYSRYGTKPVEQGRMFPLMVEAFLHGEAAARPRLVAESREALAGELCCIRTGHVLLSFEPTTRDYAAADALLASGVVTVGEVVTLATPAESGDRYRETVDWLVELGVDRRSAEMSLEWAKPAPVASQGDTPEGEEWEDPEPWQHGLRVRHGNAERDRYCLLGGCVRNPRTREQYEADQKPASIEDVRRADERSEQ